MLNGPTKFFFDDPATDRLLAMVLSLGTEVATLREELLAVRAALAVKGALSEAEVSAQASAPATQAARDAERERLAANLLFPLQQECERLVGEARKARA